ncbi:MAG: hypothetical protein AAGL97_09775 [Pseudomonadota bacterium]
MENFAQGETLTYLTYAAVLIGQLIIALFALPKLGWFSRLIVTAISGGLVYAIFALAGNEIKDARLEKARHEVVLSIQQESREFHNFLLTQVIEGRELDLELLATLKQFTIDDALSDATRDALNDAQYAELEAEFEKYAQELKQAQREFWELAQAEQQQTEARRFEPVRRLSDPEYETPELSAAVTEDTSRADALEAQIEEAREQLAAMRRSNENLARRVETASPGPDWQVMDTYTPATTNGDIVVNVESSELTSPEEVNALVQDGLEENGVESIFEDGSPVSELDRALIEARLEMPALEEISDAQNARLEEMSTSLTEGLEEQSTDLSERMAELSERQIDLDSYGTTAIEDIQTEAGASFDALIADVNSVEDYQSDFISDARTSLDQAPSAPRVQTPQSLAPTQPMQRTAPQQPMRYNPQTGMFSDGDSDDMLYDNGNGGFSRSGSMLTPSETLRTWDNNNGNLSGDYGLPNTPNYGLNNDFVGSGQDWNSSFRNDLGLPNTGSFEFSNPGMPSSVQNWSGNVNSGLPD